jgi:sigma-B regulation protein RsbU (phosphoserine phosphatase)
VKNKYENLLKNYLQNRKESDLYEGQQLSKLMMDEGVSPEELVGFHIESIKKTVPDLPPEAFISLDFLLEVMIGYGLQYREHQSLREKQIQLQSEIQVAATMQNTLLPPVPNNIPEIDLGVFSVAANEMSGDYYYFHESSNGYLGLAVADIIGKGIPAALCMSMIKYAIESLKEQPLEPHALLGSINRVVEKNIDPTMFITMIYGSYNTHTHSFSYATAGHEPGLYYSSSSDTFIDLKYKGAVLGLSSASLYVDFTIQLEPGDMLILFTDGVTESKKDGEFIEREDLTRLIHIMKDLPPQQLVEAIHQELVTWSNFELSDDQTIVIIKRRV